MTKLIGTLAVSGTLVLLPPMARPQDDQAATSNEYGDWTVAEAAPPSMPVPSELPPPPPSETPAPPAQAEAQSSPPSGQWVYTQQYGWIWMPYSDAFTYAPASGYGAPYAYVYYPAYGWTWLAAPWVWGVGPWPFFGVYGPARFAWYVHGWWRYPARWHYAPFHGGYYASRPALVYRGRAVYGGIRPAPYRGGAVYRGGGPRPAYHGGGFGFTGSPRGGGLGSRVGPMGGSGFGSPGVRSWGRGGGAGFSGHGGFGGHGGRGGRGRG